MVRFVWSQIRHRASRSAALVIGVALAAASVVVLTGVARTSQIELTGTIQNNFRSAYDIVVRPEGSTTAQERDRGLLQGNYLSGLYGGITMREYRKIAKLPGVDAAAPVANIGYLLVPAHVAISVDDLLNHDPVQIFRITSSINSNDGLSTYPSDLGYIYVTRTGRFVRNSDNYPAEVGNGGRTFDVCQGLSSSRQYPPQRLDDPAAHFYLNCFSTRTPEVRRNDLVSDVVPRDEFGYALTFTVPVQVAALVPEAEQALVGLAGARAAGQR